MAIAPDPAKTAASDYDIGNLLDLATIVRDRLLHNGASQPTLSQFGWSAIDHLGVRVADLLPRGMTPELVKKLCEEVGRRFMTVVLPTLEECEMMDAKHVAEYFAVLSREKPDASALSAAYGSARLKAFAGDRRLVYRTAGYRGQPGDPLADHLIAEVVRPAVRAVTAVPA